MKTQRLACLTLLFISVFSVSAQQKRTITGSDFSTYFQQSEKTVGSLPFRDRTFIEMGEGRTGPWSPYSSWIMEGVHPDRSRITYTSGRFGDFIHIGKVSYSKAQDGTWTNTDRDVIYGTTTSPSARGFTRNPHNSYSEYNEGDTVVVTVLSRNERNGDPADTESYTYHYYFDRNGILVKHVSIVHNGFKWVKRTENFEYDPAIRIEAPIDR